MQAASGVTSGSATRVNDAVVSHSTLNWNDTTNFDSRSGVYTLMGPGFYLAEDGYNIRYNQDGWKLVKDAIDIMRAHGYRCKLPPKDHLRWDGSDYSDEEENEKDFLQHNYYEPHEVFEKKSNSVAFVVTAACSWIYIRCMTERSKDFAMEHIMHSDQSKFCYLARIAHGEVTETVDEANGLSITRRSGNKKEEPSSITTLFEMKMGSTVIAKSLCTYSNSNLSSAGPTIELLEVAKDWRRKGYGTKLVKAMETFFEKEVGCIYRTMFYMRQKSMKSMLVAFLNSRASPIFLPWEMSSENISTARTS